MKLILHRTLFLRNEGWPVVFDSDPHRGHAIGEVMKMAGRATNDMYGTMHTYIMDLITRFCLRLRSCSVILNLHCVDARELPAHFETNETFKHGFDRIEVSYIVNGDRLGCACTE